MQFCNLKKIKSAVIWEIDFKAQLTEKERIRLICFWKLKWKSMRMSLSRRKIQKTSKNSLNKHSTKANLSVNTIKSFLPTGINRIHRLNKKRIYQSSKEEVQWLTIANSRDKQHPIKTKSISAALIIKNIKIKLIKWLLLTYQKKVKAPNSCRRLRIC